MDNGHPINMYFNNLVSQDEAIEIHVDYDYCASRNRTFFAISKNSVWNEVEIAFCYLQNK